MPNSFEPYNFRRRFLLDNANLVKEHLGFYLINLMKDKNNSFSLKQIVIILINYLENLNIQKDIKLKLINILNSTNSKRIIGGVMKGAFLFDQYKIDYKDCLKPLLEREIYLDWHIRMRRRTHKEITKTRDENEDFYNAWSYSEIKFLLKNNLFKQSLEIVSEAFFKNFNGSKRTKDSLRAKLLQIRNLKDD